MIYKVKNIYLNFETLRDEIKFTSNFEGVNYNLIWYYCTFHYTIRDKTKRGLLGGHGPPSPQNLTPKLRVCLPKSKKSTLPTKRN